MPTRLFVATWNTIGLLIGAAVILAATGCVTGRAVDLTTATGINAPAAAPAGLASLPGPLTALRSAQATLEERSALGDTYLADATLWNRVERWAPSDQAHFSPSFVPATYPRLDRAAWCVYRFHLPDYHDTSNIVYYFGDQPTVWREVFFGLGNLDRDTWDWYPLSALGRLELPSLAPYLSQPGDELVLAVVATGETAVSLDLIEIGDNSAPVAELTANPTTGPAPLSVHLDGSGSYDYEGSIVNFEWDTEGDGTYEQSGANLQVLDHVYTFAGSFNAVLRVTDEYGVSFTATVPITVTSGAGATWHLTTADAGNEETGWYADLENVAGFPAVAYLDHKNTSTPGEVRYVRALDAQGTAWGTPLVLGDAGQYGGYLSLEVIDGKPAVSYGDGVAGDFKYRRATDAEGTVWDPAVVIADDPGTRPGVTSLAVVDGRPAVAYIDTVHDLWFIRALDTTGATWPASSELVDGTSNASIQGALIVAGGVPQVVYLSDTMRDVKLARSENAQGSVWETPEYVVDTNQMGVFVSAAVVQGYPTIAYIDSTTLDLLYLRALDDRGRGWGTPLKLNALAGTNRRDPSLAVIGGQPAVSYYDQDNGKLVWVRSSDTYGFVWDAPQVVDNPAFDTSGWNSALNEVSGMPCIAYYNFTQGALQFAALY